MANRARPLRIAAALVVVFGGMGSYVWLRGRASVPAVAFEFTEHDFGDVAADRELECLFRFHNAGSSPMRIKTIHKACGCLVADTSTTWYEPGAEGSLNVILATRGLTGPKSIRRTLLVEFEPATIPPVELALNATIQPYVSANPASLVFSQDESAASEVRIRRNALPRRLFERVRLTAPVESYRLQVKRGVDELICKVLLVRAGAGEQLPDLMVFGPVAAETDEERLIAVIGCRRIGPRVVPSAYIVTHKSDSTSAALSLATRQSFEFRAAAELRVVEVVQPSGAESLIRSEVKPDGVTFSLELTSLPPEALFATDAVIKYSDAAGNRFGQIVLPVRVIR